MANKLPLGQQFLFDPETQEFNIRFSRSEAFAAQRDPDHRHFGIGSETDFVRLLDQQPFAYADDEYVGCRFTFREPHFAFSDASELEGEGYMPAGYTDAQWELTPRFHRNHIVFADKNRDVFHHNEKVEKMTEKVVAASVAFVVPVHAADAISPIRVIDMSYERIYAIQRRSLDDFLAESDEAPGRLVDIATRAASLFVDRAVSVRFDETGAFHCTLFGDCSCFGSRAGSGLPKDIVTDGDDRIVLSQHNFDLGHIRPTAAMIGAINATVIAHSS